MISAPLKLAGGIIHYFFKCMYRIPCITTYLIHKLMDSRLKKRVTLDNDESEEGIFLGRGYGCGHRGGRGCGMQWNGNLLQIEQETAQHVAHSRLSPIHTTGVVFCSHRGSSCFCENPYEHVFQAEVCNKKWTCAKQLKADHANHYK